MPKHRIYTMIFARVYPMYIAKAEKKGRTKAEVDKVIRWLTGYTQKGMDGQIEKETNFEAFFAQAPKLNPARTLIMGVICGVRIENIGESSGGAFLWEKGRMQFLGDLTQNMDGWNRLEVFGINDAGYIVGEGSHLGQRRAFLLTPVPEPSSIVLLGAAGVIMLVRRLCQTR